MQINHPSTRAALAVGLCSAALSAAEPLWLTLPGSTGPGAGKRVVLVSGDEEYHSEESLPMLGRLLAARHGFDCSVHFAVNKTTGEVDPDTTDHIPGLEALARADLLVICTRFRDLPDDQMRHLADYLESGRPVIGIRPAVVAFRAKPDSAFPRYGSNSQDPDYPGGFGQQVLGSTWISHHGAHGRESTRGVPVEARRAHPILRGVGTMWGAKRRVHHPQPDSPQRRHPGHWPRARGHDPAVPPVAQTHHAPGLDHELSQPRRSGAGVHGHPGRQRGF
jgi:hypothetical protein